METSAGALAGARDTWRHHRRATSWVTDPCSRRPSDLESPCSSGSRSVRRRPSRRCTRSS